MKRYVLSRTFQYIITALTVAAPFCSFAGNNGADIRGKINTSDGKAAANISVAIKDMSIGVLTNDHGEYMIKNLKPGNYILKISAVGIAAQEKMVTVNGDQTLEIDFIIKETSRQLQDVRVNARKINYSEQVATVATKLPISVRGIPNTITIVGRQLMNDLNYTTVSDAIQMVGGTTMVANGDRGQSWAAFSRGYAMPVMNDGIPSQSSFSLVEFDLSMYQQVEVLKGPAGVLQGTGEGGGTINLVRKQAASDFGWEAGLFGGSWNNYRAEAGITGPLNKKKSIKGRVNFAAQRQNYFYDRTHQNLGFGYGILEFDLDKKTELKLSGSYQAIDVEHGFTGLPESVIEQLPRSANLNLDWQQSHPKVHEEVLQLKRLLGQGWQMNISTRYSGRGSFVKNGFIIGGSINPVTDSARYMQNEFNKLYNYSYGADANVTGKFQLFGQVQSILTGFNIDWSKSKNVMGGFTQTDGVDFKNPDVPEPTFPMTINNQSITRQYGIYSQLRLKLTDPLSLLLGARSSWYLSKSRSTNTDWKASPSVDGKLTPYAGIVYDLNSHVSLYSSYSSIFTPQSGSLTYEQKPLQPRTGWQTEAGIKGDFLGGNLQASLAGFLLQDKNRALIDASHSGSSETYYIAAGKVSSRGLEAQVNGSPVKGLGLMASYSYLTTRYDKDTKDNYGKSFDLMEPRSQIKYWSNYHFSKGSFKNLNIGAGVTCQSKFANISGTKWQKAYAIINAQLGYRFNRDYSLSFTLNNLLDKSYFQTINAFVYGVPRSFTLAVRKSL